MKLNNFHIGTQNLLQQDQVGMYVYMNAFLSIWRAKSIPEAVSACYDTACTGNIIEPLGVVIRIRDIQLVQLMWNYRDTSGTVLKFSQTAILR